MQPHTLKKIEAYFVFSKWHKLRTLSPNIYKTIVLKVQAS